MLNYKNEYVMKTLALNKKKITNLTKDQQKSIHGGIDTTNPADTVYLAPTDTTQAPKDTMV
jgi:hypothetical protein